MEYGKAREHGNNVEKANESEEQWHVDPAFVNQSFFHIRSVDSIKYGTRECQSIANSDLPGRLVWKASTILVMIARDVDAGDE